MSAMPGGERVRATTRLEEASPRLPPEEAPASGAKAPRRRLAGVTGGPRAN